MPPARACQSRGNRSNASSSTRLRGNRGVAAAPPLPVDDTDRDRGQEGDDDQDRDDRRRAAAVIGGAGGVGHLLDARDLARFLGAVLVLGIGGTVSAIDATPALRGRRASIPTFR